MRRSKPERVVLAVFGLVLSLGLAACSDESTPAEPDPDPDPDPEVPETPPPALSYIGSEGCAYCHTDRYNELLRSGHPYKLNKVVDGQPPTFPFSTVPSPPNGLAWSDIAYVIGGFGWKARFIGLDGYIITEGGKNQYNLATGEWVDYHADEKKAYTCGACHTTGYTPEGHQDGLEGIIGQWAEPGIGCEACHGPGSLHAKSPDTTPITVDSRPEQCGSCHNRGGVNSQIIAKGGFIRHHEQYNEFMAGDHRVLDCVTCHDPHTGVRYDDEEGVQGIRLECGSCHGAEAESFRSSPLFAQKADMECIDCHMPFQAKSALASGEYVGDVRTHIFTIDMAADAEPYTADGAFANPHVTSEFACLSCHEDRDKEWAAASASLIHGTGPPGAVAYVGSAQCQSCHSDVSAEFVNTGHPYKLNKVVDGQPPTYPFTAVPNPPAGVSWDDVAYVIGGYGWKARFIGQDGYIITAGGKNQYNLATGEWVDYNADQVKPYNCGGCHTTGYTAEGNQDGRPGLIGQWAEPGVGCEACHGPGSLHVADPSLAPMAVDTRPEQCGSCHNRGGVNAQIPAKGGFIRHHEQYNELQSSDHKLLSCVTCHDPHKSTRWDDLAGGEGIRTSCETCHSDARQSILDAGLAGSKADMACTDCHMPKASKSALAVAKYVGDVSTHIFRINTDAAAQPFTPDGAFANPYLTTEFACLGCHDDRNKDWAQANAPNIHGPGYSATRMVAQDH